MLTIDYANDAENVARRLRAVSRGGLCSLCQRPCARRDARQRGVGPNAVGFGCDGWELRGFAVSASSDYAEAEASSAGLRRDARSLAWAGHSIRLTAMTSPSSGISPVLQPTPLAQSVTG